MGGRPSLKDQAYAYIRDAIVSGELEDGSQHSVYRLADHLGISRTPTREAVLQLAEAGLVTVERNRGIRIHGITVADIRDIFELRLLIEVPATAYAAVNGDDDFVSAMRSEASAMESSTVAHDDERFKAHDRALHDHIISVLNNGRMSSTLGGLRDVTRAHGAWTGHNTRDVRDIMAEHELIVDALAARDPKRASDAMRTHLIRTGTLLMEQIAPRTGEQIDPAWWHRLESSL
ncbi:GntR family transcriptional regulator [Mycobacterium sp. CBMA293]|uniref:GntR family transcriptional regulator n=1 Tax=unclassified Mycolicibacterium TaxID=2636767 RepID=UPI0012DDD5BE|nr:MULTISPECIES: GntR family transcriptional regulator [unclassified Mycolicibacterium]MUL49402.1 GntR family transcriptional regulator [Mycolicibacterium sp. CBMA 360]MUL62578.1 GntR family transcriptional regulator [Mycolicibacterium sp. CBMA 335]MUL69030.1 GntR family transcriptional regulator [Mycolicibacterium sp. CBMA 311]MUL96969.1 GntR family transcriptional regulator [Mycolicibacterium sp. CBMA 230]MUM03993.1 hypothetical protein [Mycolicibacterium sp. CBMA 213]